MSMFNYMAVTKVFIKMDGTVFFIDPLRGVIHKGGVEITPPHGHRVIKYHTDGDITPPTLKKHARNIKRGGGEFCSAWILINLSSRLSTFVPMAAQVQPRILSTQAAPASQRTFPAIRQ